MAVITISRDDVTREQVAEVLRRALGLRYHVLPGAAFDHSSRDGLVFGDLDTIVVGTGSRRNTV